MRNFTRAQRKKAKRKFKVGDVVTWGAGAISHRVIEVQEHGVVVDATSKRAGPRLVLGLVAELRREQRRRAELLEAADRLAQVAEEIADWTDDGERLVDLNEALAAYRMVTRE